MKKTLIPNVVIFSLIFTNVHCQKKETSISSSRLPASTLNYSGSLPTSQISEAASKAINEFKNSFKNYPSSFINFLNGSPQRLKFQPTLKQYSKILPTDVYEKLVDLAKKVDDQGFTLTRKDSDMILKNSKGSLKIELTGPLENIGMVFENKTWDLNQPQVIKNFIAELEQKIQKQASRQTIKTISTTTSVQSFGLFYKMCLFSLPFYAPKAEAIATGWFILGGLAIIGLAIAISANRLGKSIKNTQHQVNMNHNVEVGLNASTQNTVGELTNTIKEFDPTILSNNTIQVTPIETTTLPDINTEGALDSLGISPATK